MLLTHNYVLTHNILCKHVRVTCCQIDLASNPPTPELIVAFTYAYAPIIQMQLFPLPEAIPGHALLSMRVKIPLLVVYRR